MPAPTNSTPPAITGTEEVGYTLTVSNGTWTGGVDSYAYQWQESANGGGVWTDIAGGTQSTHVLIADDVGFKLRCQVTATNQNGSTAAFSNETGTISDDWMVVEDGSGKTNAISFVSVQYAQLYHAQRNNAGWVQLTVGAQKAALIKATDYMEQVYRLIWLGYRKLEAQALSWPRDEVRRADFTYLNQYSFYPNNQVPVEEQNACCELALRAATNTLAPDIDRVTQREKVGPLEVEYQQGSAPYTRFRAVDNILAPFLDSGSSGTFRNVMVG